MCQGVAVIRRLSWLFAGLPALFVLLMAAVTAVGLLAAVARQPVLASAAASRVTLVVVVTAVLVLGRVVDLGASSDPPGARSTTRSDLMASVPGLVLAAWGVTSLLWPLPKRIEWFLGGDHVR